MWFPPLTWAVFAAGGRLDAYQLSAAFALLVAFPVMLRLDTTVPRWLVRASWLAGPLAASSLLMDRGVTAAVVASVWLLVAVAHLIHGAIRFINAARYDTPAPWGEAVSAFGPLVGGVALVWSRYDGTFAGFGEPLATLTVTHFHFTFGLLPLALAAAVRAGRVHPFAVWGVVFAPPLVGLLFATRVSAVQPSVWEAGAIVLLAVSTVGLSHRDPLPRLAALVLAVCTALAAWFSVNLALDLPTLDYAQMLRWHGIGNALATLTLGLTALPFAGAAAIEPSPHLTAPTRDVEGGLFRDNKHFDLGADTPERFVLLADRLLRYTFYPPHVMRHHTTFEGRHAVVGDRIGMTLYVDLFPGFAPIALPATTEVFQVEDTPDRASIGYLATTRHYGKGAWVATLTRESGRLKLTITSRMTPLHPLALAGLPIYRWYQKRAHRLGAENLGKP
jgi:hypothetical protein